MAIRVEVEATFMNLSLAGQQEYEAIREQVRSLQSRQQNGLELMLNALVATGSDTTLDEMEHWIRGLRETDNHPRDLVELCHDRPITVEPTIIVDA